MTPSMEQLFSDGHAVDKALLRRWLVAQFDTIASMKTSSIPTDDARVAYVAGYSVVGDGGEGFFRFDASSIKTDDAGVVIKPTTAAGAGRWVRLTEGAAYSVKWFGARGDGATDDQPSIQAAVNAAIADNVGAVFLPAGSFKISKPIGITEALSFRGVGYEGDRGRVYTGDVVQAKSGFHASVLVADPNQK